MVLWKDLEESIRLVFGLNHVLAKEKLQGTACACRRLSLILNNTSLFFEYQPPCGITF